MRVFIYILSLFVSLPSSASSIQGHQAICEALTQNAPGTDSSSVVAHLIGQRLDFENQKERLERLTGAKPLNRTGEILKERGSDEGRDRTREVLMAELRKMGYKPTLEKFDNGANIVATIEGLTHPKDVVEVTAHFDSVHNPGADDNGSGLSLTMELARLMKAHPPGRSVRFVLMDLEEVGFQGSLHHTEKIKENEANENLLGVIVIDTIAWAAAEPDLQLVVMEIGDANMAASKKIYDRRMSFAQMLTYQLGRMGGRDTTLRVSVETSGAFPRTADHGSYWMNGLPAVLIGEAFENGLITPKYHSDEDQTWSLNWGYYESVSRIVAEMLAFSAQAQLGASVESSELDQALAREDQSVGTDPGKAWPPKALAREPFLPPWAEKPGKPDPDHISASRLLDRAFVLGDLAEGTALFTTRFPAEGEPNRAWFIGDKSGVIDVSNLNSGALAEIGEELKAFGGEIWAVDGVPTEAGLKRLRREFLDKDLESGDGIQERDDFPSAYFNIDGFDNTYEGHRSKKPAKILKALNNPEYDSVLALARRREDGHEVLYGGLAVRQFNGVEWSEVGPLTWDEVREMKAKLNPRHDGTPPIMIFTGASFNEGWRHHVLARVWTAPARLSLIENGNDKFITEF